MAVNSTKEEWLAQGRALDVDLAAMQEMAGHGLVRGMSFNHIQIGSIEGWYDPNISIRAGDTITFEIVDNEDALGIGVTVVNAVGAKQLLELDSEGQ